MWQALAYGTVILDLWTNSVCQFYGSPTHRVSAGDLIEIFEGVTERAIAAYAQTNIMTTGTVEWVTSPYPTEGGTTSGVYRASGTFRLPVAALYDTSPAIVGWRASGDMLDRAMERIETICTQYIRDNVTMERWTPPELWSAAWGSTARPSFRVGITTSELWAAYRAVSLLDKTEGTIEWQGLSGTSRWVFDFWGEYKEWNPTAPSWISNLNEKFSCVITGTYFSAVQYARNDIVFATVDILPLYIWSDDIGSSNRSWVHGLVFNYSYHQQVVYHTPTGICTIPDIGAGVIASADLWQVVIADRTWTNGWGNWEVVASTSVCGGVLYAEGEGVGSGKRWTGAYTADAPWSAVEALSWPEMVITNKWTPTEWETEGPPRWTGCTYVDGTLLTYGRMYHTGTFPITWRFTRCRK